MLVKKFPGVVDRFAQVIAVSMSLFHLYTGMYQLMALHQRVIHLTFAFVLALLTKPLWKKHRERSLFVDLGFAVLAVGAAVYVLTNYVGRVSMIGKAPPVLELFLGGVMILLSLDISRRASGWGLTAITILLLLYARFGEWIPGVFSHKDYDVERIVSGLFMTTEGVFGNLVGVSATYIFLFVLFSAFFRESGAGDFFIDFAYSIVGRVRGGSAKIAVIASSLFGMITGSTMANVAAVGQFTIPLMKKGGYQPHFAGAVETVSGNGAALVPPVLGGTVFLIMEILNISYLKIMIAVIPIAILYYLGVFLMVDLEAVKHGLKGLDKADLPSLSVTLKKGCHFLVPLAVLFYFLLMEDVSPTRAAFWATISVVPASWLRKSTRMGLGKILKALESGAKIAVPIAGVLACANILDGIVTLTGLGISISGILLELSGGVKWVMLVFTMIASIVIGTGAPVAASYILLAVLVCPALVQLGVLPLAAHLFVYCFAIISVVTPPTAPAAFVAAGIAEAPMMKTAMAACKLSLIIFIIPFMFVYNPVLLMEGNPWEVILSLATAGLGVWALAAALQGYLFRKTNVLERLILFAASVALIRPGVINDVLGMGLLALVVLWQKLVLARELSTERQEAVNLGFGRSEK